MTVLFNPLGLVQASKPCVTCERPIFWSHFPGKPGEHEPTQQECRFCAPASWQVAR